MRHVGLQVRLAPLLAGALAAFARARPAAAGGPAASGAAGPDRDRIAAADPGGRQGDGKGRERTGEADQTEGRSASEWTTLAVSTLVVALLVGAALYEHFARDEPSGVRVAVELAIDRAEERDGLTYVPFTVVNTGAAPAENVVVLFEVKRDEETVEESTAEIAFLPNSGLAEGELVTALDLGAHAIEARVATIQKP